jgi:hypothetical protein
MHHQNIREISHVVGLLVVADPVWIALWAGDMPLVEAQLRLCSLRNVHEGSGQVGFCDTVSSLLGGANNSTGDDVFYSS